MDLTSAKRTLGALACALCCVVALLTQAQPVEAVAKADPFYSYDGATPLAGVAPGTVLKTRTMPYHVLGLPTPVRAVQLLYRTVDAQNRPIANVASVLRRPGSSTSRAVAYLSFYDSLNPEDGPSRAIAGDVTLGGMIANFEATSISELLGRGYTVIVPDTQGQRAEFAAGPIYGTTTLDAIRAASRSEAARLTPTARVGLYGYSGGAIAAAWASQLAPEYAPDVNARLVGVAEGGILVNPARNLRYVSGSQGWSGVMAMAIIGLGRAFDLDFGPYISDYGKKILARLENASILNALFQYPGLTWEKLVKPPYADPASIPIFVEAANRINLGSRPSPTVPVFIGQGANGSIEGTKNGQPGIGPGDAVMIAGDVRSLARQYCATNPSVYYEQYDGLSHNLATFTWGPAALRWMDDRFAGRRAPSNCGRIPPGNSLAPQIVSPPQS